MGWGGGIKSGAPSSRGTVLFLSSRRVPTRGSLGDSSELQFLDCLLPFLGKLSLNHVHIYGVWLLWVLKPSQFSNFLPGQT